MSTIVVVGTQWGDEGKGKIVDFLASQADVVARFQGGSNAGHTVTNEGREYKLHLLPSGILYSNCICVIGSPEGASSQRPNRWSPCSQSSKTSHG